MITIIMAIAILTSGCIMYLLVRSRKEYDLEELEKNKYDYLKNQLK